MATKPYDRPSGNGGPAGTLLRRSLARLNPALPGHLASLAARTAERAAVIDRGQAGDRGGNRAGDRGEVAGPAARGGSASEGHRAPAVICVAPADELDVPRLRARPERILRAAEDGYRLLCTAFDAAPPTGFEADPCFRALF